MTQPSDDPPLAAVLAIARNGVIGRDGALPWIMPGDLARFRDLTMGKPMIMGRRTYASIGRALPGRDSIVVSRQPQPDLPEHVYGAASPADALMLARTRARDLGATAIALIGGAELFRALLPRLDRIHLTIVDCRPEGDTFLDFPDPYVWRELARSMPQRHSGDEANCVFVDYVRG